MMLQIDIHRWFTMVAILNPKWPPKYKNPPIWTKLCFQADYDVAQRWISIRNIIIYLEAKFRPNQDFCILVAILDSKWPP
jgi:hypothetical protein